MLEMFKSLFGLQSKPVRRDAHLRMTVDVDGNPTIETVSEESFSLSVDGSTDRVKVSPDRFYHCGCNADTPVGGQCGEPGCRRISCANCFRRCARCFRPGCLEHSRVLDTGDGGSASLCIHCYDEMSRKKSVRTVAEGLLSPFVDFEARKER